MHLHGKSATFFAMGLRQDVVQTLPGSAAVLKGSAVLRVLGWVGPGRRAATSSYKDAAVTRWPRPATADLVLYRR